MSTRLTNLVVILLLVVVMTLAAGTILNAVPAGHGGDEYGVMWNMRCQQTAVMWNQSLPGAGAWAVMWNQSVLRVA